jgi:hypothetical protein
MCSIAYQNRATVGKRLASNHNQVAACILAKVLQQSGHQWHAVWEGILEEGHHLLVSGVIQSAQASRTYKAEESERVSSVVGETKWLNKHAIQCVIQYMIPREAHQLQQQPRTFQQTPHHHISPSPSPSAHLTHTTHLTGNRTNHPTA